MKKPPQRKLPPPPLRRQRKISKPRARLPKPKLPKTPPPPNISPRKRTLRKNPWPLRARRRDSQKPPPSSRPFRRDWPPRKQRKQKQRRNNSQTRPLLKKRTRKRLHKRGMIPTPANTDSRKHRRGPASHPPPQIGKAVPARPWPEFGKRLQPTLMENQTGGSSSTTTDAMKFPTMKAGRTPERS